MIAALLLKLSLWGPKLLRPKVLIPLLVGLALIAAAFYIRSAIIDYGLARELAGKTACETAVKAKAKADKAALDDAVNAGKAAAEKTRTVFVQVTKEIAVQDAKIVAENVALKTQLETLNERIDNAPVNNSLCARQPISADSLRVHTEIDDLLDRP